MPAQEAEGLRPLRELVSLDGRTAVVTAASDLAGFVAASNISVDGALLAVG